jgi:NADPH:quinone reductase-like Zn-dependent oxidoreductase
MKAILLTGHGGPEMLRYGDAPDPIAGPGEILVDIFAASVNAADYKVRLGGGRPSNIRFPHILGRDFSGTVSAVGEDTARLKAGETILIQGGAGGVAGFAIQLAHHIGATVITTASAGNHDYVRRLGADRVIDYNKVDFPSEISGCDVVFDTVGGTVRPGCYQVLKPGGRLVWIAPAPEGFEPPRADVQTLRPAVTRDRAHLERMLTLLEAGAVSPPAITRYKLADAAEAHRVSEARHLRGKLVLEMRPAA